MATFGRHAAAANQHRHCARLSLSLRVSVESHVATLLPFGAQRLVQLAARQMTAAVGPAEPPLRQHATWTIRVLLTFVSLGSSYL
jgi:hypothetical protein